MSDRPVIPLACPEVTDEDRRAVMEVLSGPTLSIGPKIVAFEEAMARYAGRRYGIGVSSGTAGLHLVVRGLGIGRLDVDGPADGPGDEVITTPYSFVASANCILFQNARPRFVDIDPATLNLNADLVESAVNEQTRAILAVDVFGLPAELPRLAEIAARHKMDLIEDSCEALGASYSGRPAGSFGRASVFAFYANKQITTGEGGMIVTDDAELAEMCRSLRNQGRGADGEWLAHPRLGFNYRLSEINAALGLSQLGRIESILAARHAVAQRYIEALSEVRCVQTLTTPGGMKRSWFVFVVRILPPADRDRVMRTLRDAGIQCRPYFAPIHLQPFYVKRFGFAEGDFPATEAAARQTLALPFHNSLSERDLGRVVSVLRKAVGKL